MAASEAGVGLIGGTDCENPYVFPGFSLHDELELLVGRALPAAGAAVVTRDAAALPRPRGDGGHVTPARWRTWCCWTRTPSPTSARSAASTRSSPRARVDRAALDGLLAGVEAAANGRRRAGTPGRRGCRCAGAAEGPVISAGRRAAESGVERVGLVRTETGLGARPARSRRRRCSSSCSSGSTAWTSRSTSAGPRRWPSRARRTTRGCRPRTRSCCRSPTRRSPRPCSCPARCCPSP